ncbi:hypothetical protein THASP1DRAFT_27084 [Thamnocephalis sphaerospora]|uniref:RRM domain-containing protein n=1 Tax=Thamnocephalis sphaerospora TaxID=78915 RepID=A0A4P9XXU1_9FUNG|nr:hypothetical protein THASP1DRAFT_27084 [Thamnocephalis sphaerospora]|eukprot:RKP11167.1 hypothetical protein THASP1DRAFT_27084 [Thamnocephalis sphaerospora]
MADRQTAAPAPRAKTTEAVDNGAQALRQRVYLGGLASSVQPADVQQRLQSFGAVSDVVIARDHTGEHCRGFAYVTLDTTEHNWKRCVTMLNGTKWKGSKLRIEKAKPDFAEKLDVEQKTVIASAAAAERKLRKKRRRDASVRFASDMTPVSDKNMDGRRGWKRSRYGRAVLVMHLRKPDGSAMVYDPSMYKNNLEKLFGSERPLPVERLTWRYGDTHGDGSSSDDGGDSDGEASDQDVTDMAVDEQLGDAHTSAVNDDSDDVALDANAETATLSTDDGTDSGSDSDSAVMSEDESDSSSQVERASREDHSSGSSNEGGAPSDSGDDSDDDATQKARLLIKDQSRAKTNQQRQETVAQRAAEREKAKATIRDALADVHDRKRNHDGHVIFSLSDEEQENGDAAPEEDSSEDEALPPVQSRAARHKDERFRVNDEFYRDTPLPADDDATGQVSENTDAAPAATEKDELDTSGEKARSMDILRSMFGGSSATTGEQERPAGAGPIPAQPSTTDSRFMWRDMEQFDPDDPTSFGLLVNPDIPVLAPGAIPAFRDESDDGDDAGSSRPLVGGKQHAAGMAALPQVDDSKHFAVRGDLKSMFKTGGKTNDAPASATFTLFGGSGSGDEEDAGSVLTLGGVAFGSLGRPQARDEAASIIDAAPAQSKADVFLAPDTLFFAHFGRDDLLKRTSYRDERVFLRPGTTEKATKVWESTRQELTRDFKQRHKQALRLRKRQNRDTRRVDA